MSKNVSIQNHQVRVVPVFNEKEVNGSYTENALKMMKKRYLQTKNDGTQETPAEMLRRVAKTIAGVEKKYGKDQNQINKFEKEFYDIMASKAYTPAGRTVTNAGSATPIIANCIVLPVLDSMESIFQTLKDAALLQQAGSGLGFDFSHLRPAMTPTKKSRGSASGPVSFLRVYDTAFGVIKQQGRHGANMAMMQIDHPDALDFIRAKEREGDIRNFNISIKMTESFMRALTENPDQQWYCTYKGEKTKPHNVLRNPNGSVNGYEEIDITVGEIFDELVSYAWANGEPGIVFIDEVNKTNPLPGLGPIDCSNPCGEQFLHHYDNCNLGSINLAVFVKDGKFDYEDLKHVTRTSVRMMDNVIDLFDFPVQEVTDLAQKNRRIGLGIMGFSDALYQLGVAYNSEEGRALGEKMMSIINEEAHKMSEELAEEKGVFPNITKSIFHGKKKMRNAALTTVAPTGSISMMYDCSSGIEPNFALGYIKQDKDGLQYNYFNKHFKATLEKYNLTEDQIKRINEEIVNTGSIQALTDIPEELRKTFVVAMDISAEDHMKMQAAFQRNVDNSISKTINFPFSATKEDVREGYISAWRNKCKSCTVYRDGSRTIQVLNVGKSEDIVSTTEDPTKINKKKAEEKARNEENAVDKNRITPRVRPEVIAGRTYKVKTGYGNLYVTINDDDDGVPFEVFATLGKSGGFFQEQSEGLCRLISRLLRSRVKVTEIIDDLKGIRGPMPVMTNKGTILSLPDAIAQILEEHINAKAGQIEPPTSDMVNAQVQAQKDDLFNKAKALANFGMAPGCPECGGLLKLQEGCSSCLSCGYSRCG